MAQIIGGISPAAGAAGYMVFDVPSPAVIGHIVVNSYTTLQVPAYFRAVNFRASNMARFPRSVRKDGVDVKHRLDRLLQRSPNNYQNATMFWRTLYYHQSHYANGFAEIERDSQFNPKALHNRHPQCVAPFRILEDDGTVSQWYCVTSPGSTRKIIPFADMLHLSSLSDDGAAGMNPVWLHTETFERARLLDRYETRFLMKGGIIRGSVEIPAEATPEQIESLRHELQKFKGADAEEDTIVLGGGATLNNKSLPNDQAQLVQLHQLSTKQVAQLTDVDPYWMFDKSESKYSGDPEQSGEEVVRYLFSLLIEQAEDELIKLLSPEEQDAGYTIHIDPSVLIRGDGQAETTNAVAKRNAGIIDANEARSELGYPPHSDPDANKLKALGDTSPANAATPQRRKSRKTSNEAQ